MLNVYYENIKHKDKKKVIALSVIYMLIAVTVIVFFDYNSTVLAVAATFVLTTIAMTTLHYAKDDYNFYASTSYSLFPEDRRKLALHEAGHALVRMSFFPRSTEIDLMNRIHDEHGNVSLMNVNNFTDDEKKQLIKKFGITGYYSIEGYFIFAGQAAESFTEPQSEPQFHELDEMELQIKKYDKTYLRKNMYGFLNDNLDLLFEIQRIILTTDRKFVDYSDFGHLSNSNRIKSRELLTKMQKEITIELKN